MRMTRQRAAIMRVLEQTDQHPTADWIYEQVRHELPRISLGTVYRLLHSLHAEGVINILDHGNGRNRFDGNPGMHHHIVCTACGQIADVPELVAFNAREEIERWTGYAISRVRLDWYGLCPACRAAGPSPVELPPADTLRDDKK
jgi:Fur family peroxide stress response transcriptional regulator